MWKRRTFGAAPLAAALLAATAQGAFSHCEMPCGIYGDQARFEELAENIRTVEKSVREIQRLSGNPGENANQLVRWINNKERHADNIKEIVAFYFLTQRVRPPESEPDVEAYHEQLEYLHRLMISAMKAKQTVDLKHVRDLEDGLRGFKKLYMKTLERE